MQDLVLLDGVHWGKAVLRGREGVKEASFQGCTQLPGKDIFLISGISYLDEK